MKFSDFPLKPQTKEILAQRGLVTPTPIQAAALPLALEGRDLMGQARTGTGKTLAFALPIAERLEALGARGRPPRALVLTPTRELALQVAGELKALAPHLEVLPVYGGTGYTKQREALARGVDVVVATPGRASDFLRQGVLDLSRVEIAVLDEADEMLSMGFADEVEALLQATPPTRQTLLFSATLPPWAKRLGEAHMRAPVLVNVIRDQGVGYEEEAILAPEGARSRVLADLLYARSPKRAMVFVRTKAETEEVASDLLGQGLPAKAIHGDLTQAERERVLRAFRRGEVGVLVGTDVAARGLDIPEVDLVVHYHLPQTPEAYQHRSGRTGRAGRGGKVVVLYGPKERKALQALEKAVGRTWPRVNPPTPEEVLEARWPHLLAQLARYPKAEYGPYLDYAQRLLAQGGVEGVAALLRLLLGPARRPERSLLTGEAGWTTFLAQGPGLTLPRLVARLKGAGLSVGKVEATPRGFYVDLRPQEAGEAKVAGVSLSPASGLEGARS